MNRYLVLLIGFGMLLVAGCYDSGASEPVVEADAERRAFEARLDSLAARNAELEEEARLKHEFLEEYITLINQTLAELDAITDREGMLREIRLEIEQSEHAAEARNTIGQRIEDNLAAIERYLEVSRRQREDIERQRAELNRIARAHAIDVSDFEATIQQLNALLEEKEQTIAALRKEAEVMLAHIDVLTEQNTVLAEENTELREAYYVVGTRDELKERGIIDRSGGFLRIGRRTRIESLDAAHFVEATVETDSIFVGQAIDKVQILTGHRLDASLYRFEETTGGVYLRIVNPEQFWRISRFLIIEVKQ